MPMRTRIILPVAILVAMVAVVGIRVLWGARVEFRRAEVAVEAGDKHEAVVHYGRALRWYVPGDPLQVRVIEALLRIGEQAEAEGNRSLALGAYRAIRNASFATRSFYMPHRGWLERANQRIAALEVSDEEAGWPDRALPDSERYRVALEALRHDPAPSPGWSLVAVTAFLGWLGAFVGLIWRGFDAEGRLQRTPVVMWATGFVVAYALWILGLALA